MRVFLIWIIPSKYRSHEFIYWAHTTGLSHLLILSFDVSFLFMCVCAHNTIFNTCSFIRIYWYTCAYPCMPLGIHNTTRLGVLTPLDPHVQVSELGACGFSLLLMKVAQRKRGSSADCLKPHPSRPPCSALEFSCYDSESLFLLFIIVYLLVFSHLHLSGDVIFL